MSEQVSPDGLAVLLAAEVSETSVRLPNEKLERSLYEEVNEVLVRLGGKWKRRGKAKGGIPQGVHVFPYDPAPLLTAVRETGDMPPKNPTAFFPTPPDVVTKMIEWADLAWFNNPDCRILEPSAGTGAILSAIKDAAPLAQVDAVELLPINASLLRSKGHAIHETDFLGWDPEYRYDAVLMNPPFSVEGDAQSYITHIEHAWELLRDDGHLVAIAPNGLAHRNDARTVALRTMIAENGEWTDLPAGAFKESGTGVQTLIVWAKKQNQAWKANPYSGWPSWHCWAAELWADCEREFHDARERIYERIQSGALPLDLFGAADTATDAEIRKHYAAVIEHANKSGEGIRPSDSDWPHLVAHFMGEYRLWLDYQSEAKGERSAA